jgi:hypothetical protein
MSLPLHPGCRTPSAGRYSGVSVRRWRRYSWMLSKVFIGLSNSISIGNDEWKGRHSSEGYGAFSEAVGDPLRRNWFKNARHYLTLVRKVADDRSCPANGCSSCLWLQYLSGLHLHRLLHLASTKFNVYPINPFRGTPFISIFVYFHS